MGICKVVLPLGKDNCIVVGLELSDKECLFQFELEPKDEIMNFLLFGEL